MWVDLYDSTVEINRLHLIGLNSGPQQLKQQNYRIRSRGRLKVEYDAAGRCAADRTWWIKVRRGSAQKTLEIKTGGTSSTSRTVDLGPASRWQPID